MHDTTFDVPLQVSEYAPPAVGAASADDDIEIKPVLSTIDAYVESDLCECNSMHAIPCYCYPIWHGNNCCVMHPCRDAGFHGQCFNLMLQV